MKIKSNRIVFKNSVQPGVLNIINGKIVGIDDGNDYDIDYGDYIIFPGPFDIHTHGCFSYSGQSIKENDYVEMSLGMAKLGTTSFLVTAGEHNDNETKGLQTVSKIITDGAPGAKIQGIHMEGPFLNPEMKGAFLDSQLLPVSIERMKKYISDSDSKIKYVTISPELEEADELISFLKSSDIIIGAGHTNSSFDNFFKSVDLGVSVAVHTGNAMSQIDRRDVGAVGAALLSDSIYCEIICDFIHLSKEMIELVIKVKGIDKTIIISDSSPLSGLKTGQYSINGKTVTIHDDGSIRMSNNNISGSSRGLLWGIKNLYSMGISLSDISIMASYNPAKLLGLDNNIGSIEIGKYADFLVLDDRLSLKHTFINGECIYSSNEVE